MENTTHIERNTMKPLEREFHYYLAHQDELVREYNGKYIVIQNTTVLGAYDSEWEAVQETTKQGHALGTFFVQKCEPELEVQTYHSRVRFENVIC
jgi:hypothetical protein